MHIWLINHYDSFTFNVRDWLLEHPAVDTVRIVNHDDAEAMRVVATDEAPIVLSPGPKDPESIALTADLVRNLREFRPVLGLCLGHQLLGVLHGSRLIRARRPLHGSRRRLMICHKELADKFEKEPLVAVYHSLVLHSDLAPGLLLLATDEDGDPMAIASTNIRRPFLGWQFHPESFLTADRQVWSSLWIDYCRGVGSRP